MYNFCNALHCDNLDGVRDGLYNNNMVFFSQNLPNAHLLALTPNTSSIRFNNVSFQYVPGKSILQDLSFDIEPGKKYAIVGGSGSG